MKPANRLELPHMGVLAESEKVQNLPVRSIPSETENRNFGRGQSLFGLALHPVISKRNTRPRAPVNVLALLIHPGCVCASANHPT